MTQPEEKPPKEMAPNTTTSLWQRILNYRPDFLITLILLAVATALIAPVSGTSADIADIVVQIAIAFLFFLYGARLSHQEAFKGLIHWRLHLLILFFTFVFFPLIGVALTPLHSLVGNDMFMGILYLTLVPSTVQSSVAFTSIARGHVAASIIAASVSSLLGVLFTPLLVLLLMSSSGGLHINTSTFINISIQLLLPFLIGQLLRPWIHKFAAAPLTKRVDQISIGLVVYVSFSDGVTSGAWSSVSWITLILMAIGSIIGVYAMLTISSFTARKLGFNYANQVAIQFAGTKKSLAAGLPMAAVMFTGQNLGLLILPLMIFHQVQLIICSIRASKYAKRYAQNPKNARTW